MSPMNAEGHEVQPRQWDQQSVAGASPMHRPDKPALYKHVARADIAVAEVADLIGALRGWLGDEFVAATSAGDVGRMQELAAQWQNMQRALAYLRLAATPAEWEPYLPAIRLDDPTEAQQ
jgi:hypothetical protein